MPLFNQNGAGKQAAIAARDRANAELALQRIELTSARARAERGLIVARERVTRSLRLAESAERVVSLSLLAYREGAATLPVVIEAQRTSRGTLFQVLDDIAAVRNSAGLIRLLSLTADAGHAMRSGLLAIVLCLAGCAKEEPAHGGWCCRSRRVDRRRGRGNASKRPSTPPASCTARPGRVATLAAPAAARVANVFVAPGSPVHAGDPLIEFEQAPFEAARKSAESALLAAEHAADRSQRLADAGVLPRKEAEAAAAELANARLNATNARRASELATLHAPFGGTVTRMTTTLGATVDPTQPLVEVTDTAELDVILTLSPADAARTPSGESGVAVCGRRGGRRAGGDGHRDRRGRDGG